MLCSFVEKGGQARDALGQKLNDVESVGGPTEKMAFRQDQIVDVLCVLRLPGIFTGKLVKEVVYQDAPGAGLLWVKLKVFRVVVFKEKAVERSTKFVFIRESFEDGVVGSVEKRGYCGGVESVGNEVSELLWIEGSTFVLGCD